MTHPEVLKRFKELFPQYFEDSTMWFPNGKNSIRIRMSYCGDLVFSIDNKGKWIFETISHYLDRMEIERRLKKKGDK